MAKVTGLRKMSGHRKRPRDPLQLAKLIGDIATGQVEDLADSQRDTRSKGRR